jgi:hypothetical protein
VLRIGAGKVDSAPESDSAGAASPVCAATAAAVNHHEQRMGYLWIGFKRSPSGEVLHLSHCLAEFGLHVWVAATAVFVDESRPGLKQFLFVLLWTMHTAAIAVQRPLDTWAGNARQIAIGFITAVSGIISGRAFRPAAAGSPVSQLLPIDSLFAPLCLCVCVCVSSSAGAQHGSVVDAERRLALSLSVRVAAALRNAAAAHFVRATRRRYGLGAVDPIRAVGETAPSACAHAAG